MDVSHNVLSVTKAFGSLQELEELDVSSNSIRDSELAERPLRGLLRLNLADNALDDFEGRMYPSLCFVNLELNQLRQFPSHWSDVKGDSLEILLSCNPLCRLVLFALPVITRLALKNCRLKALPLDFSRWLADLEEVDLSENDLSNIAQLSGCLQLRSLNLSHNQISDCNMLMGGLSCWRKLSVFDVRWNPLTAGFYGKIDVDIPQSLVVDSKDRAAEDDKLTCRRLFYRALCIYRLKATLTILDGIAVSNQEKAQAGGILSKCKTLVAHQVRLSGGSRESSQEWLNDEDGRRTDSFFHRR